MLGGVKMEERQVIEIKVKTNEISFDEVRNVMLSAHEFAQKKKIFFGTSKLSAGEMEDIIGSDGVCFIATLTDKVVGTLSISLDNMDTWYFHGCVGRIRYVAVLPEYQGRHIASKLIERAMVWMREQRIDVSVVSTPSLNFNAIQMYVKSGFRKAEFYMCDDYYVVRMVKFMKKWPYSKLIFKIHYEYIRFKQLKK